MIYTSVSTADMRLDSPRETQNWRPFVNWLLAIPHLVVANARTGARNRTALARLVAHGASGAPVRVQHRLIQESQLTSSPDRIAVNVIPAIAAHTSRNAGHDDRIVGSLVGPDTLRGLP